MKKNIILPRVLCSLSLTFLFPSLGLATSLEPSAAPSSSASATYKTDDIYNRLQSGTSGTKRSGAFTEPGAGPVDGVGKTLDEIMSVAPVADNINGAAQIDVIGGKTFWGLRTDGTWGIKTGTAISAPLPRTGQTTCYNASGAPITCAGTGQDGDKHKGVSLPTPRFTTNNNGTVTDNLTGLIWLTNANCYDTVGGIAKGSGSLSWTNALAWSNSLASGSCGLSDGSVAGDWRLPNDKELFSLVNDQYYSPVLSNTAGTAKWIDGDPFSNVQSSTYVSSTTKVSSPTQAWGITFSGGYTINSPKTAGGYVWPVRDGG